MERVDADTYSIRLALQKGNNELVFITRGDGWGFIAAMWN